MDRLQRMKNMFTLRLIDLTAGIGAGVLGFQRAGFEVVCAVAASETDKSICGKLTDVQNIIVGQADTISPETLPEADVIAARLPGLSPSRAGKRMRDEKEYNSRALEKVLLEKKPAAFVLESAARMLTGNRLRETVGSLGDEVLRRYYIQCQIFDESKYSGFPVSGKEAFIVGIRSDLLRDDFYFPAGDAGERRVFLEKEEMVDGWYRQIRRTPDIPVKQGHYYVRRVRDFSETDKIITSFLQEMYLADGLGFRRFTHNECAVLKGITGYDFNRCSNRYETYRKISRSSNAFVVQAVARGLRAYFEPDGVQAVHAVPPVKQGETEKQDGTEKKSGKKKGKKADPAPVNDILYPMLTLEKLSVENLKGIRNLQMSFEKNLTAIMGVNGCGKSTIIHALACVFKPYRSGENYKFSFFFTPNPDSSWKNSKFSITYRDERTGAEATREYRKNQDRWAPRYDARPVKDVYYIGIDSCVPDIERESQTSFIDYQTSAASDRNAGKIVEVAAYILNKDYDQLNYHRTKKKQLLGVHTAHDLKYSSLSMGAGEQRVLKILQTVYAASSYSMILIDEIDLLLHVTALKRMTEHLARVARRKNLQIIFTTHSMEMSRLQDYVDIRYLDPLPEKTMVYDRITADIVYELSNEVKQDIRIFVEDILAETIVNIVAADLDMSRHIKIIKTGAARNGITLASGLVLQQADTDNVLVLLDGDVYRTEREKKAEIEKVLSGTEKDHGEKVEKAAGMIRQLGLPEGVKPEKYIFDMLVEMDDQNELTRLARKQKAVSDSHEWIDSLVKRMGKSEEIVLYQIISLVSEHERWGNYVEEVREWLRERRRGD